MAQNPFQQKWIRCHWHSINLMIGSHRGHSVPLPKGRLKRPQHYTTELAFTDVNRGSIRSAFWRTVSGKVFWFAYNCVIGVEALPLRTAHIGQTKPPGKERIFTEIFFHTSPPGITSEIQYRSKNHVYTGCPRLCCDGGSGSLRNLGIPSRSKVDRSWKYRSRVEAMQCFFNKQRGNSQTIVVDDPLLDSIRLFRRWIQVMNAANAKISPKSLRLVWQENGLTCRVCGIGMLIYQSCGPGIQIQLTRLFLHGHATQQIGEALFNW